MQSFLIKINDSFLFLNFPRQQRRYNNDSHRKKRCRPVCASRDLDRPCSERGDDDDQIHRRRHRTFSGAHRGCHSQRVGFCDGHRRFETLISLGIGIAVIVVGVFIAINAIETLWKGTPSHPSAIVGVCALLSVISKEWLFRYTRAAGRKIRSQALEANAWHHRSDALSSIPVVIAVILTYVIPSFHYFDTLGALFVAILVAKSGVDIAWPGLNQVSDAGASAAITEKMLGIARDVPGVISVHDFRSRYIGNDLQVNLHIVVDAGMTLLAAHDLSEEVERRLIDCGENVTDALVHVDPYDPSKAKED